LRSDRDILSDVDPDRLSIALQALRSTIDFDEIRLRVTSEDGTSKQRVLVSGTRRVGRPSLMQVEGELTFWRGKSQLRLSAGQTHFAFMIIRICAHLKNRSLLLIDEPETGLHPNAEVEFMRTLKSILHDFNSFAVVATHSMLVVREVPTSSVRLISHDEWTPIVRMPRMETFGADISAICDEVFGDLNVTAAYHAELRSLSSNVRTFSGFLRRYEKNLSDEALAYVRNEIYGKKAKVVKRS
jgi:hypothetical protein